MTCFSDVFEFKADYANCKYSSSSFPQYYIYGGHFEYEKVKKVEGNWEVEGLKVLEEERGTDGGMYCKKSCEDSKNMGEGDIKRQGENKG